MKVFIGYDEYEKDAVMVAESSLRQTASIPIDVHYIGLTQDMVRRAIYRRPTIVRNHRRFDLISGAPMSTGHAIARFFLPHVCADKEWMLFVDGDVLFRRDVAELLALRDERYAVMVVPHKYEPIKTLKKGSHVQSPYFRKNWSSVMLWNGAHIAHECLTLEVLNSVPGRDLHQFCWIKDEDIGFLPEAWNWLAGHSSKKIDPAIVHFTEGLPHVIGCENVPYADEWRKTKERCLAVST